MKVYNMVEEIAAIDAAMAELKARRDALRDELIDLGPGSYEGPTHVATVFESERRITDWRAVAERFNPSRQLVAAHTAVTTTVSVKLASKRRLAA